MAIGKSSCVTHKMCRQERLIICTFLSVSHLQIFRNRRRRVDDVRKKVFEKKKEKQEEEDKRREVKTS